MLSLLGRSTVSASSRRRPLVVAGNWRFPGWCETGGHPRRRLRLCSWRSHVLLKLASTLGIRQGHRRRSPAIVACLSAIQPEARDLFAILILPIAAQEIVMAV